MLMPRLISVAVPVPFLPLLTYRVPDALPLPVKGARVLVPLGTRRVTGCVIEQSPEPPATRTVLKDIFSVLDEEALVPEHIVDLAMWVSEYYACGPGEAIALGMPPGSRGGRASAFRTVRVAALTAQGEKGSPLSIKQLDAIEALRGVSTGRPVSELKVLGIGVDTLTRLAKRGLVSLRFERVERNPLDGPWSLGSDVGSVDELRALTDEQAAALDRLTGLADRERFSVALVHGVTGSGKTEIYRRLAERVCARGRTALVLVPEIGLTPGIVAAFRSTFGDRVAIQHSGLSDGERHDQWHRIRRGDVSVVVGTRSAVASPLRAVGLIVVDEEHDHSYKQDETPRYHGRDVAVLRGKREEALVVLGSATPSMESYRHATSGRYELVTLERRVHDRPLAHVRLVNMRDEYARAGPDVIVSEPLNAAIADRLDRHEQVLLLLNRRGYATTVFCRTCAGTIDCPNCSVSLIVHQRIPKPGPPTRVFERVGVAMARCHYCNYARAVPKACPHCAAPYLLLTGFGTERVEADVAAAFPRARTSRLDRDVARRKGAISDVLRRFSTGEIDVLVGTQMIAKGHDFPRVTLVGVISADVGLGLADFRAAERTFQLLTQVVGRAGRGELAGEAIVQTLYPDHYSVRHACRQDYAAFFREELQYRKAMRYPPVVALINAIVRSQTLGAAMTAAGDLAGRLRDTTRRSPSVTVLGPAPAPLVRLRGDHRAQLFLKGDPRHRVEMREAIVAALAERPDLKKQVTIDVDPVSVL